MSLINSEAGALPESATTQAHDPRLASWSPKPTGKVRFLQLVPLSGQRAAVSLGGSVACALAFGLDSAIRFALSPRLQMVLGGARGFRCGFMQMGPHLFCSGVFRESALDGSIQRGYSAYRMDFPDPAVDKNSALRAANERLRTKLMFAEAEIQGLKENLRRMRAALLTPAGTPTGAVKTASRPMPDPNNPRTPPVVRKSPLIADSLLGRLLVCFERKCFYCAQELDLYTVTLDHLHPKSKGGNGHSNMVPACLHCNNAKGDRLPTPQETERAAGIHAQSKKPKTKHRPEPLTYFPLADIKLGSNGRVICPTRAHGSS